VLLNLPDITHAEGKGPSFSSIPFAEHLRHIEGEDQGRHSPSRNMPDCSGPDCSSDGEAPARGGESSCVVSWLPVAGYRHPPSSAASDVGQLLRNMGNFKPS